MEKVSAEIFRDGRPTMTTEWDELLGAVQRPRVTPRNSLGPHPTPTTKLTPYTNLRQLAGLIRRPSTPRGRASSVEGLNTRRRVSSTTPKDVPRTTPRVRRPLQVSSGNRSKPTTPYGIRAHRQRRTTPGRERRKSGKMQRETPRDALRNLSKALAKTSEPVKPSPPSRQSIASQLGTGQDDFEDELSSDKPTFSVLMEDVEQEDESSFVEPPRLSMQLEDGEHTAKSIEMPRRALNGEHRSGFGRGSLNAYRPSDHFDTLKGAEFDDERTALSEFEGVHNDGGSVVEPYEDGLNTSFAKSNMPDLSIGPYPFAEQSGVDSIDASLGDSFPHAASSPFVLQLPELQAAESPTSDGISGVQNATWEPQMPVPGNDTSLLGDDGRTEAALAQIAEQIALTKPTKPRTQRPAKVHKVSRYGTRYPRFPSGITRSVASAFMRALGQRTCRLNKEALNALIDASDLFFERLGGDLSAMSKHAGRSAIDETDVIAVMQRQRQVSVHASPFFLAAKQLPAELLKDVGAPVKKLVQQQRSRKLPKIVEVDEKDH